MTFDDMRVIYSDQYNMACISVESAAHVNADALIAACETEEAIRYEDGIEYCVELRHDVGPELLTEEALRRTLKKERNGPGQND